MERILATRSILRVVALTALLVSPAFAGDAKISVDLRHDTDSFDEAVYFACGKLKFGISIQGTKQNTIAVLSTAKQDVVMALQGAKGGVATFAGQGYVWTRDEQNEGTLRVKGDKPVPCEQTGYPGDGMSPDWPY